jgi:hypothetical protein
VTSAAFRQNTQGLRSSKCNLLPYVDMIQIKLWRKNQYVVLVVLIVAMTKDKVSPIVINNVKVVEEDIVVVVKDVETADVDIMVGMDIMVDVVIITGILLTIQIFVGVVEAATLHQIGINIHLMMACTYLGMH